MGCLQCFIRIKHFSNGVGKGATHFEWEPTRDVNKRLLSVLLRLHAAGARPRHRAPLLLPSARERESEGERTKRREREKQGGVQTGEHRRRAQRPAAVSHEREAARGEGEGRALGDAIASAWIEGREKQGSREKKRREKGRGRTGGRRARPR